MFYSWREKRQSDIFWGGHSAPVQCHWLKSRDTWLANYICNFWVLIIGYVVYQYQWRCDYCYLADKRTSVHRVEITSYREHWLASRPRCLVSKDKLGSDPGYIARMCALRVDACLSSLQSGEESQGHPFTVRLSQPALPWRLCFFPTPGSAIILCLYLLISSSSQVSLWEGLAAHHGMSNHAEWHLERQTRWSWQDGIAFMWLSFADYLMESSFLPCALHWWGMQHWSQGGWSWEVQGQKIAVYSINSEPLLYSLLSE